jgi:hypothetical protein
MIYKKTNFIDMKKIYNFLNKINPKTEVNRSMGSKYLFRTTLLSLAMIVAGIGSSWGQCTAYTTNTACTATAPTVLNASISCVTPSNNGGRRNFVVTNMVAGYTYRVSNCGSGYDTQMTIRNASAAVVGYNDDNGPACTGSAASIDFVPSTGGTYRIQLNRYDCLTTPNASNGTITVTLTNIPPPTITASGTLSAFSACQNTASSQQSFTVSGTLLTANIVVTPPTGFQISQTSGSGFSTSAINLEPSSGSVSTTTIYVRMASQATSPSNGNIACTSTGATTKNVAVSGTVANTAATATTGASSSITGTTATLAGSYVVNCQNISGYGIFYSTTNGFANGAGTQVSSSNQSSSSFTSSVSGLNPSTTYYYKAYATYGGTTVYGSQSSFTTSCAAATIPWNEGFESGWGFYAEGRYCN